MPRRSLPSLDDIEFISERTDEFLGELIDSHQNNILGAIEKLERRIVDSLTRLEANPEGRLEGLKVNMKQAQAVHKQMVNAFAEEYGVPAERMIGEFSTITNFVEESYSYLGEAEKFTKVNRETLETLQKGFGDQYARYGKEAEEKVTKAMYEAVIAGEPFSSLLTTVTGALLGHVDRAGRPMAMYAKQHAFDSVMNFNNQVNLAKTEQLGMKHFLYFGNIMGTTRPFCEVRAGNIYSKEQIESWNDMPWAGKAGPPMIYRGGYNCRHHWRGVRPEWFGLEEDADIPATYMADELVKKGELKRKAFVLWEAGERDAKKILAALGPEGRPERVAAWMKAWDKGKSLPPQRLVKKLKEATAPKPPVAPLIKQAKPKAAPKLDRPAGATTGGLNITSKAKNITTTDVSRDGKQIFKSVIKDGSGQEQAQVTWFVFEREGRKELFFAGIPGDITYGKSLAQELYDIAKRNNFTHVTGEKLRADTFDFLSSVMGPAKEKRGYFEWVVTQPKTQPFGLPYRASAEEWLKHRQVWEHCDNLKDIELQFQNKYNIGKFIADFPGKTEKEIVQLCNEAGENMAGMWRKMPKINDHLMNARPLNELRLIDTYARATDLRFEALKETHDWAIKNNWYTPYGPLGPQREGMDEIAGFYYGHGPLNKRKIVACLDTVPGSLPYGQHKIQHHSFLAIRDRHSYLRHEYGHYLQDHLNYPDQKRWIDTFDKLHKREQNIFSSVSTYGTENHKEFWAEFFGVISHPHSDVDAYFKKILADSKGKLQPFVDDLKKHFDPSLRPLPTAAEKFAEVFKEAAPESNIPRFGLALDAKDADWLKHRQAWTPVDSLEDAKLQFKNKYNIKKFEIDLDSRMESEAIRYCNELGETLADMYQKAPGLNDQMMRGAWLDEVKIFDNSAKTTKEAHRIKSEYYDWCIEKKRRPPFNKRPTLGSQNELNGYFWGQRGSTLLATIDKSCQPGFSQLTRGSYKSMRDRWGTFRHEYGHFCQRSQDYTAVSKWQSRFEELQRRQPNLFSKVSQYSSTNHGELYSEMFRVATMPGVDLDEYFETLSRVSRGKLDFFIEQVKADLKVVTRPMPGSRRFLIPLKGAGPGVDFKKAIEKEPLLEELGKKKPKKPGVKRELKVDKPSNFKPAVKFEVDLSEMKDAESLGKAMEYTRIIETEIKTIENKFPNIGGLINQEGKNLKISFIDESIYTAENLYSGGYSRISHKIDFPFRDAHSKTSRYGLGTLNKVVDNSVNGVLRHSMGQTVFRNMDQVYRSQWIDILEDMKSRNVINASFTARNGTRAQAFGEYFSVYTSPLYKRGDLPMRVESLLDDITGGRLNATKQKLSRKAQALAECLL
jgi:hypothetical protein